MQERTRMKLATFFVAAAVHAQDNKTGKEKKGPGPKKPLPVTENGDSKANFRSEDTVSTRWKINPVNVCEVRQSIQWCQFFCRHFRE